MNITTEFSLRTSWRTMAATLGIVATMVIAGCGSGTTPAPASSVAAPSTAPSTATLPAPAGGSAGADSVDDSCGATTAALLRTLLHQDGIISITNEGGCRDATIVTSLTDEAQGLAICNAAAKVAYKTGDIFSITVTGANDVQLAGGDKDVPCLGRY